MIDKMRIHKKEDGADYMSLAEFAPVNRAFHRKAIDICLRQFLRELTGCQFVDKRMQLVHLKRLA